MASQVPPDVSEPIAAAARDAGVQVYHAELSGRELRVEVESESGASVRTCSDFSRALSIRLDAMDFLHGQYTIEVSSPGIERRLYEPADFGKAINRRVRLRTRDGLFDGRLVAAGPVGVTVNVETGPTPADRDFAYAEIREARIRVPDSELFARDSAQTRDPELNHQDTKSTRPLSFGPAFVSLCLSGGLLLRFLCERIT
jgi:ribosome maturation factor RimP